MILNLLKHSSSPCKSILIFSINALLATLSSSILKGMEEEDSLSTSLRDVDEASSLDSEDSTQVCVNVLDSLTTSISLCGGAKT